MTARPQDPLALRLFALITVLELVFVAFLAAARPWYLNWGATDEERRRVLPGDEILANPAAPQTRAITIGAPVERVWPWLAQLGQDRGGFYSYDLLENLVGCEMPTRDHLRPDRQSWELGDKLWMYPPRKAGGIGFATLRAMVPGRALAFGTRRVGTPAGAVEDGVWSFAVEPVDAGATRLLVRGQGEVARGWLGTAFDRSIFEPLHFVMERRMMIGIKQLAEGTGRPRWLNHLHVGLWILVFGTCVSSIAMVLGGWRWRRALVGVAASAVAFQVLTLAQPPIALAVLLVAAVALSLFTVPSSPFTS